MQGRYQLGTLPAESRPERHRFVRFKARFIPKNLNSYSIVHLEMLNIVVALKVWASQWLGKKIEH